MPPPIENTAAPSTPNARLAPAPPSGLSAMQPHPSPSAAASHTVYSDRFIPSRSRSNLALFDLATPTVPSPYCELLSVALFWPATPDRVAYSTAACSSSSSSPSSSASPVGVATPGSGNLFRFKVEAAPRRAKRALFAGGDKEEQLFAGISTARGGRPRKIPRTPYKVCGLKWSYDDRQLASGGNDKR